MPEQPEPMFNESDVAVQMDFDGKQAVIRFYGNAKVVQSRLDDYLKLKESEVHNGQQT